MTNIGFLDTSPVVLSLFLGIKAFRSQAAVTVEQVTLAALCRVDVHLRFHFERGRRGTVLE